MHKLQYQSRNIRRHHVPQTPRYQPHRLLPRLPSLCSPHDRSPHRWLRPFPLIHCRRPCLAPPATMCLQVRICASNNPHTKTSPLSQHRSSTPPKKPPSRRLPHSPSHSRSHPTEETNTLTPTFRPAPPKQPSPNSPDPSPRNGPPTPSASTPSRRDTWTRR